MFPTRVDSSFTFWGILQAVYSLPLISMEISLIDSGIVDLFENCMCTSNPCGLVLYAFNSEYRRFLLLKKEQVQVPSVPIDANIDNANVMFS